MMQNIIFSRDFCYFEDISDKVTADDDVIMHDDVTFNILCLLLFVLFCICLLLFVFLFVYSYLFICILICLLLFVYYYLYSPALHGWLFYSQISFCYREDFFSHDCFAWW